MSVSDLTNTKWLFNNSFPAQYAYSKEYNINFVTNNNNYNKIIIDDDGGEISVTISYYNGTTGFISYHGAEGGWQNEAYRTIEITGGTDVTNATLIAWLEANATLQVPTLTVDLTTLTNYSSLPSGTYTITAVAKGTGTYTSSNKSTGVSYTKAASGYDLILSSSATRTFADGASCTLTTNFGTACNLKTATLGTTLATGVTSVTYTYVGSGGNTSYSMNGSTGTFTSQNQSVSLTGDMTITDISIWCLTGDMLITMADNTEKRIDEIQVGDKVLSYNGNTIEEAVITYSDADVTKTHNGYDIWEFDDGTIIKTVHRHRLYNCGSEAFVNMDEWKMGDHAKTIDGKEIALIKHEHIDELVSHYTIFTDKYNNYFVNGLLSGNKFSTEITCGD